MTLLKALDFNKLLITYYRRGQCLSRRTAPALCDRVVYLLWNYRPREDATVAGAEAIRAVALKER